MYFEWNMHDPSNVCVVYNLLEKDTVGVGGGEPKTKHSRHSQWNCHNKWTGAALDDVICYGPRCAITQVSD